MEFGLNGFQCALKDYYHCWTEKSELIARLYTRMIKFEIGRSESADRNKFELKREKSCKN